LVNNLKLPNELKIIIQILKKLPGVGSKTAERFAFHMLEWEKNELNIFSNQIQEIALKIENCTECGSIKNQSMCFLCDTTKRDSELLCIVANAKDIFLIEQTSTYQGLYHVLNNLLSPLDGKLIENTEIEKIKNRVVKNKTKEILIAIDSTIEGDATSLFLKHQLTNVCVKFSRMAFGMPLNSSLDYIDEGTLARALLNRQSF
jgi:recombination protein RecR